MIINNFDKFISILITNHSKLSSTLRPNRITYLNQCNKHGHFNLLKNHKIILSRILEKFLMLNIMGKLLFHNDKIQERFKTKCI